MSTPQITLADCLAEVNNALNYWYPTRYPLRDGESDAHRATQAEHDARHVRLFQFRDRLQQQLRAAGKSAAFDLAMAMAELANVAAERDRLRIERDEAGVRAGFADLAAERRGDELQKLRIGLYEAVAGWNKAAVERDNARQSLRAAEQDVEELDTLCNDFRRANSRLVAERDAMQTDNGILRTVNLSLTTDLRAAVQRADTAEAILRAKA
jgi:hypothetical protein